VGIGRWRCRPGDTHCSCHLRGRAISISFNARPKDHTIGSDILGLKTNTNERQAPTLWEGTWKLSAPD